MFGISYQKATNIEELQHNLQSFYQNTEKPKLLELTTERTLNDKVLLKYFEFLKK